MNWKTTTVVVALCAGYFCTGYAYGKRHGVQKAKTDHESAVVSALMARADTLAARLDSAIAQVERAEAIFRMLKPRSTVGDSLTRVVAMAVMRESERWRVSPRLLAGVVSIENPWLVSDTVSFAGAVGIAQIMPMHAGSYPECGHAGLTDPTVSVCYGAAILRRYVDRALNRGLLDYNGCVRTPGCERYAGRVLAASGFTEPPNNTGTEEHE